MIVGQPQVQISGNEDKLLFSKEKNTNFSNTEMCGELPMCHIALVYQDNGF